MAKSSWANNSCPEKLSPWKITCQCYRETKCDCGKSSFYNVRGPDVDLSCSKVHPCYASLPDQVLPLKIPSAHPLLPKGTASIKRESTHFEIQIFDEYHEFMTSEWDSYCLEKTWMIWQRKDKKIYRQYAGFCSYDWLHEEFKLEKGKLSGPRVDKR